MASKFEEKRKSARKEDISLVRFEGENFSIYTNARNISPGGIFLNTYYLVNEGTRLHLDFELPNTGKAIAVDGEVVWRGKSRSADKGDEVVGMGIKFLDLKPEDAALINNYVKTS